MPRRNNNKKSNLRKLNLNKFCKLSRLYSRGDIFYFDFGKQAGSIQSGIRPVVIIQNDKGNEFSPTTIVAPVTSQNKRFDLPTHVAVRYSEITDLNKCFYNSTILFEQIFTVNKIDLRDKIGWINLNDFKIKRALEISVGLKN